MKPKKATSLRLAMFRTSHSQPSVRPLMGVVGHRYRVAAVLSVSFLDHAGCFGPSKKENSIPLNPQTTHKMGFWGGVPCFKGGLRVQAFRFPAKHPSLSFLAGTFPGVGLMGHERETTNVLGLLTLRNLLQSVSWPKRVAYGKFIS